MRRALILAAALAVLLPALVRAGEEEPSRRVLFVPNDRLETILEKHGRGVMLTVEEYLALYHLAERGGLAPTTKPASDAVILGGAVSGVVTDESATLTLTYRVRLLKEGVHRVRFHLDGAAVHEAKADGKPALLARDAKGGFLVLSGVGDHDVEVKVAKKLVRKEEARILAFPLPAATSFRLDLAIPKGMVPDVNWGAFRVEESKVGNRLIAHLPPRDVFGLKLVPREDEGSRTARIHVRSRVLHRIGPRLLRTVAVLEANIYRRGVTELYLTVPADTLLTEVSAPDLEGWSVDGGRARLVFRHPASGIVPVALKLEKDLPGPGDLTLPEIGAPDAADVRGLVGVTFEPGLGGRVLAAEGYSREPIPAPPPRRKGRPAPKALDQVVLAGAAAAYRYWSPDRSVTVRTEAPEASIDCDVTAALSILEESRELVVDFQYRPRGERIFALSPTLPKEYEIRDVVIDSPGAKSRDWSRGEDGRLNVTFPSGVAPETLVRITVRLGLGGEEWRSEDWSEQVIDLPVPDTGVTKGEVVGRVVVIADEGYDLQDLDSTGLRPEPVRQVGVAGARLAWLWRGTASGRLSVTRREAKVSVRHVAIVSPGEKTARYSGFLHYTIKRAGIRRFRFQVSGGYGDRLRVLAPGTLEPIRTAAEDGSDLWEVTLPKKVRGELFIAIKLEEEMAIAGASRTFTFPEVTVLDVQDETGYLAVESGDNMEVALAPEALREIGVEEMDSLMSSVRYTPSRGLLEAYQYSAHPWSLSLSATRFRDKSVLTAFVSSAKLVSVVGADGLIRTRATYRLLNSDRQFLKVRFPEDTALWGALVGGKPVKLSAGRDAALVPLTTTTPDRAVEVVLMLETTRPPLDASGELNLEAPVLPDVLGAEAEWVIWFPSEYAPQGTEGVFGATFGPTPDPWVVRAFADFKDAVDIDLGTSLGGSRQAGDRRPGSEDKAVASSRQRRPASSPRRTADERVGYRVESLKPMEQDDSVVEDPVIRDAKVTDHNESENDVPWPDAPDAPPPAPATADPGAPPEPEPMRPPGDDSGLGAGETDEEIPFEESLGEKDFISDAPFDGPSTNASIGIGGGSGGRFGGRGGRRVAVPVRLGLQGGMSLDVPLVTGGAVQRVRALGVQGGVRITYVRTDEQKSTGYVVSVVVALLGLLLTGVLRRGGGVEARFRVPSLVFVVVVGAFATFAPAWFGARDLTIWDAIARGAFWAALVIVGFFLARRIAALFTPRRRTVVTAALLLLLLAAPAVQAGPDAAAKPDEETVYVPYDPDRIGALDGVGRVFLPFEKFQELWNAAHPDRRLTKPEEAPVPWLLTSAGYFGEVQGETVKVTARFDLVVLAEGWVQIALPLSPAVVEEARVDGKPVRVLSKPKNHVLMLTGRGGHRVELALRCVLGRSGDRRGLRMALPAIPRTMFKLTLPSPGLDVEVDGPEAARVEGNAATVYLGPSGILNLTYGKKTDTPKLVSRVEVETRQVLTVLEGRVESRLQTDWTVVSGEISEAAFTLDPEFEILTVTGPDVKLWNAEGGRLTVTLARVVKDRTVVTLVAERVDGERQRSFTVPAYAPLDAVRERGLLAVANSPDLRIALSGVRNLDRVAADAEFAKLIGPGRQIHSTWRFVLRPLGLTVATEPVRAEVRVEIPVMHLLYRDLHRGRVSFVYDVRGDGTFEFPVHFPEELEIESVEGPGIDRWWRDGDVLTFSTASPVRGRFIPAVRFRRSLDPDAEQVTIPEIHALGVSRERGRVLVARSPGLTLTVNADAGLVSEDVRIYSGWQKIAPDQVSVYGYRQDGSPFDLRVSRSFPEARVRPVATAYLQVEDDQVVVNVDFAFRIENAGEDTFRVFLPEGEGLDPVVVARRQRSLTFEPAEIEGRTGLLLTLVLQQPAIAFYRFSLTYEKPLTDRVDGPKQGEATVVGLEPQGEDPASYVFAVNLSRGEVGFGKPEGLTVSDSDTFPYLPSTFQPNGADRDLIREAWRGRQATWSLPVSLTIRDFAEFPDALISSAEMLTTVGRDGWTRNRMTYRVLNRTRQYLEITLPADSVFEAVRVGGQAVKPGLRDSGAGARVVVPLSRMQAGDIATEVEVYWSRSLGEGVDLTEMGALDLLEPRIHGLEVERTFFTVCLPEGFEFNFDGNMKPVRAATQRLYIAKKKLEELERVVEVQSVGGQAQQSRADGNILRMRNEIQKDFDVELEGLNDEEKEELRILELACGALDEQVRSNFAGRGGSRNQPAQQKELSRADLEQLRVRYKSLSKKTAELGHRNKGKGNLSGQTWASNSGIGIGGDQNETDNDMPFDGPATNASIGIARQTKQVDDAFRRSVAQAIVPQRGSYSWQRAGVPADKPRKRESRPGYTTGGGGGGTSIPDATRQAQTRAGLLSLAVTVPERGAVHRFEKLNGGAKLTVSVGTAGTGRGWAGLGWFALVIAALIAWYRLRPHHKIPYFGPILLGLVGLLLMIWTGSILGFPVLVIAGVWAASESRDRRRTAAA